MKTNIDLNTQYAENLPPIIITKLGFYRHYKGGEYEVIGTVRHSEDLQPMTLYRALYGERGLWVRPAAMFNETVVIDGVTQPRFKYLGEKLTINITEKT
jgi:hypothetical protein